MVVPVMVNLNVHMLDYLVHSEAAHDVPCALVVLSICISIRSDGLATYNELGLRLPVLPKVHSGSGIFLVQIK